MPSRLANSCSDSATDAAHNQHSETCHPSDRYGNSFKSVTFSCGAMLTKRPRNAFNIKCLRAGLVVGDPVVSANDGAGNFYRCNGVANIDAE